MLSPTFPSFSTAKSSWILVGALVDPLRFRSQFNSPIFNSCLFLRARLFTVLGKSLPSINLLGFSIFPKIGDVLFWFDSVFFSRVSCNWYDWLNLYNLYVFFQLSDWFFVDARFSDYSSAKKLITISCIRHFFSWFCIFWLYRFLPGAFYWMELLTFDCGSWHWIRTSHHCV